ncbi:CDP-alcohol phosphatidyltransferase family protein [Raoultibacter phocaeensis]|uniref:CDP-alcohol phosphatidyltransferase family protein n=1 Tax=Raoultibacter phocaeensis TaxID=2479841 RepID=UPI0011199B11|nr:CDP-alcohol phosphatidyltransferase family protein [Raoultibacter phocaeensis]
MAKDTDKQIADGSGEPVSNRVFTVPNVISAIRLCMIPVFFVLLMEGYDILATFIYALAAGTDWIDGQIARRTHTVSKLGQLLDPAVDRLLMIAGVLGLLMVGRLPIWIIVVVLARDLLLLAGGAFLLSKYKIRVAVIYAGKVATTLLFVGFAGLLLNWPLIPGAGLIDVAWLPGLNAAAVSWGIWFVYAGLVLGLATTVYYVSAAIKKMKAARDDEAV